MMIWQPHHLTSSYRCSRCHWATSTSGQCSVMDKYTRKWIYIFSFVSLWQLRKKSFLHLITVVDVIEPLLPQVNVLWWLNILESGYIVSFVSLMVTIKKEILIFPKLIYIHKSWKLSSFPLMDKNTTLCLYKDISAHTCTIIRFSHLYVIYQNVHRLIKENKY